MGDRWRIRSPSALTQCAALDFLINKDQSLWEEALSPQHPLSAKALSQRSPFVICIVRLDCLAQAPYRQILWLRSNVHSMRTFRYPQNQRQIPNIVYCTQSRKYMLTQPLIRETTSPASSLWSNGFVASFPYVLTAHHTSGSYKSNVFACMDPRNSIR